MPCPSNNRVHETCALPCAASRHTCLVAIPQLLDKKIKNLQPVEKILDCKPAEIDEYLSFLRITAPPDGFSDHLGMPLERSVGIVVHAIATGIMPWAIRKRINCVHARRSLDPLECSTDVARVCIRTVWQCTASLGFTTSRSQAKPKSILYVGVGVWDVMIHL